MNVPDDRFKWLCSEYKPKSEVPAFLEIVDIAGLVRGAASGEGLGNAFLSHIQAVDGIFHVCRGFEVYPPSPPLIPFGISTKLDTSTPTHLPTRSHASSPNATRLDDLPSCTACIWFFAQPHGLEYPSSVPIADLFPPSFSGL